MLRKDVTPKLSSAEVFPGINDETFIRLLGLLNLPMGDDQSKEVADMFLNSRFSIDEIIAIIVKIHIENGTLLPKEPNSLATPQNGTHNV